MDKIYRHVGKIYRHVGEFFVTWARFIDTWVNFRPRGFPSHLKDRLVGAFDAFQNQILHGGLLLLGEVSQLRAAVGLKLGQNMDQ